MERRILLLKEKDVGRITTESEMDRADEQRPVRMQEKSKGARGIRKPTVQRKQ